MLRTAVKPYTVKVWTTVTPKFQSNHQNLFRSNKTMFDISNSSHHIESIAIYTNRKWKSIEIKTIRKSHTTMGDRWLFINMLQVLTVVFERERVRQGTGLGFICRLSAQ